MFKLAESIGIKMEQLKSISNTMAPFWWLDQTDKNLIYKITYRTIRFHFGKLLLIILDCSTFSK